MTNDQSQFVNWSQVLDHKAQILYAQIAQVQKSVMESGGDESLIQTLCAPYYELLTSIYSEDYPLARAIENSDLVISLEGPAIGRDNPRLSVITGVFGRVRTQVTKLAKAIANFTDKGTPSEVDLGLAAFAKGSLVLGFTLPTAADVTEAQKKAMPLFAEQAVDLPIFRAARDAIRTLGIVTHHLTHGGSMDELAKLVPDSRVRDVALNAVKELSPSPRSGIETVRISGRAIGDTGTHEPLTQKIREQVSVALDRPFSVSESKDTMVPVKFIGEVREMDLDAHRFELRHIDRMEVGHVRCVYLNASDDEAKQWLGKTVRVTGITERDSRGVVSLLELTAPVEILK